MVTQLTTNCTAGPSGASRETGLLGEREAAARLGLSVKTLRRWRWARRGVPWIKLAGNGAVRYSPCDLEKFIQAGRVEPGEVSS